MHDSGSNPLILPPGSSPTLISGISNLPDMSEAAGVDLEELPIGAVLEIETGHTTYLLENKGEGRALLSGHPKYCPQPAEVQIHGSLDPSGGFKWHFLGKGMKMAFLPADHGVVRTSSIKSIRRLNTVGSN